MREAIKDFALAVLLVALCALAALLPPMAHAQVPQAAQKHREDVERAKAEETRKALSGKAIKIVARGAEGGRLYGSVTAQEIADVIKGQGIELDKSSVHIAEPIRKLGEHVVEIKLGYGEVAKLKVSVVKE